MKHELGTSLINGKQSNKTDYEIPHAKNRVNGNFVQRVKAGIGHARKGNYL